MTDTKRLRALASKATFESSVWESEDDAPQLWIDNRENNAAWCRAANPQAIIALIDELEKMKTMIRDFAWHYDDCAAITISENEECSCGLWDELKSVGLEGEP